MREIVVSGGWRDRLEDLIGRRRESWALVILILVVASGGLLLWSRATSPQIAPPATSGPAPRALPSPSLSPEVILVHVAGAVRRPGLYELSVGARVADAVEAAGGPTRRADLDLLNLAEAVVDGQKVEVLTPSSTSAAPPPTAPGSSTPAPLGATPGMVNINTADQAALESLPEVGPVTAQAILEYREQIGSFDSVEQLLEVSGIGPATLDSMRPFVTV